MATEICEKCLLCIELRNGALVIWKQNGMKHPLKKINLSNIGYIYIEEKLTKKILGNKKTGHSN